MREHICDGPKFVKYGECGIELQAKLINEYKGPFAWPKVDFSDYFDF